MNSIIPVIHEARLFARTHKLAADHAEVASYVAGWCRKHEPHLYQTLSQLVTNTKLEKQSDYWYPHHLELSITDPFPNPPSSDQLFLFWVEEFARREWEEKQKIITQAAEQAFWETIKQSYPAATTGDCPPEVISQLTSAMGHAVKSWVHHNANYDDLWPVTLPVATTFVFNTAEAKGTVVCTRGPYGVEITVDAEQQVSKDKQPQAFVDLFYVATEDGKPLLRVYDKSGDTAHRIELEH